MRRIASIGKLVLTPIRKLTPFTELFVFNECIEDCEGVFDDVAVRSQASCHVQSHRVPAEARCCGVCVGAEGCAHLGDRQAQVTSLPGREEDEEDDTP
jgi:hypothetical protein